MLDYIFRDAAIAVLCDACGNAACPKGKIPRCSYFERMQEIPAANVRPVRRGKWSIVYDDFMKSHYDTCSCCGKEYFGANGFNFCPNCGAMMEES